MFVGDEKVAVVEGGTRSTVGFWLRDRGARRRDLVVCGPFRSKIVRQGDRQLDQLGGFVIVGEDHRDTIAIRHQGHKIFDHEVFELAVDPLAELEQGGKAEAVFDPMEDFETFTDEDDAWIAELGAEGDDRIAEVGDDDFRIGNRARSERHVEGERFVDLEVMLEMGELRRNHVVGLFDIRVDALKGVVVPGGAVLVLITRVDRRAITDRPEIGVVGVGGRVDQDDPGRGRHTDDLVIGQLEGIVQDGVAIVPAKEGPGPELVDHFLAEAVHLIAGEGGREVGQVEVNDFAPVRFQELGDLVVDTVERGAKKTVVDLEGIVGGVEGDAQIKSPDAVL